MNNPRMVKILDVKIHSSQHRTFVLDEKVDARAGQFCMLWLPDVNEKPMSFSNIKGNVWVTVKKIGKFTSNLFMLDKGDKVGFRGPYGSGFEYVPGNVCLVGGGCGIAPIRPLRDKLKGHAVLAAKNADSLLFVDDFERSKFKLHLATDDGSAGEKALAHEVLHELLKQEKFSCVYCCGPEPMMKSVLDVCMGYNTPCQFSLERYMKCAIGLCGSCTINGLRVCREGPVFRGDELAGSEFGVFTRDAYGLKRRLNGSG